MQEESQLQEQTSKLEAGSAGRQAECRFEARVSSQFRKRRLALCAACSGPAPSLTAKVFGPCNKAQPAARTSKQAGSSGRQTVEFAARVSQSVQKATFGTMGCSS